MSREFDVVIVGAGVVGSVMAGALLARARCAPGRVAIVADRLAPAGEAAPDWDLRVFALSRASQRLLQLCDVWRRLPPPRVFPYERMCVWDASGVPQGPGSLTFDCAEIGEPNLGFIVEGRALQERCLQAASAAGAVLIEASVHEIAMSEADARIRLDDGRDLRGKLLIGADGADSKTRELLGIDTAGHAYHQDALVAHVRTAKSHRNTAWQRFLPSGPLAVPTAAGRPVVDRVERGTRRGRAFARARRRGIRRRARRGERRGARRGRVDDPDRELPAQTAVCGGLCKIACRARGRCRARGASAGGSGFERGSIGLRVARRRTGRGRLRRLVGEYRLKAGQFWPHK